MSGTLLVLAGRKSGNVPAYATLFILHEGANGSPRQLAADIGVLPPEADSTAAEGVIEQPVGAD